MNTRASHLYYESCHLIRLASFIEIQAHDCLKSKNSLLKQYEVLSDFSGYVTIHGEGETDGRKRILFCSDDKDLRKRYVNESIVFYSSLIDHLYPHKVNRLIVHPDTFNKRMSRREQIQHLAESLVTLGKNFDDIEVCIEPRGGDRQGKVLRATMEDIKTLEQYLHSNGGKIGLCIDIAQLFIVHGNNGAARFLEEIKSISLPIMEFHISDVSQTKTVTNRVAMEVGTGAINWKLILPLILQHCNELLIETLGGIKVFQRSKSYLELLVKEHEILL